MCKAPSHGCLTAKGYIISRTGYAREMDNWGDLMPSKITEQNLAINAWWKQITAY